MFKNCKVSFTCNMCVKPQLTGGLNNWPISYVFQSTSFLYINFLGFITWMVTFLFVN